MTDPRPSKYVERELDAAAREFYRRLAESGRAAATPCPACERTSFPPLLRCPACGGEQAWIELPGEGRLYAFTTQETAIRFTAPAVLALAEVGEVLLPGIVEQPYETLEIGQAVSLTPRPEPDSGLQVLVFEPHDSPDA